MARKPKIIYVESRTDGSGSNSRQMALAYFLRTQLECEVLTYDYYLDVGEDINWLKRLCNNNQIILVIASQDRYVEDYHQKLIKIVREKLSPSLPIVILPGGNPDEVAKAELSSEHLYVFNHTDPGLFELVRNRKLCWKPESNWLGADTREEQGQLQQQLETVYHANYLSKENETMFGTPDANHMVVAEALRIRLLPTCCLREEFDRPLQNSRPKQHLKISSTFTDEVEKIGQMTEKERLAFSHSLMRSQGMSVNDNGDVSRREISHGDNVYGFAIDARTLESQITTGFGNHNMAEIILGQRLTLIGAMKAGKRWWELSETEEQDYSREVLTGLIFKAVDGFSTPILRLNTFEVEQWQLSRVSRFIHQKRWLIPVDYDGKLI